MSSRSADNARPGSAGPAARSRWRAVMFDVDGTLLDSRDTILASYREATREVLGRELPATAEDAEAVLQMRSVDALPRFAGDDRELARVLGEAYQAAYLRRQEDIAPYRDALGTLGTLRRRGMRLGVVTSKSRSRLDRDLARTGLAPFLDASVAGDEVMHGKPDPEPVLLGLRALGASPGEAVYVGDSPVDVAAARAAGVYCVGVLFGFHPEQLRAAGPDLLVDSYDALLEFVADGRPG